MAYVNLGAAADPLASVRAGTNFLKKGSKGDAVRALQALIRQGQVLDGAAATSLIEVDGDFGPKTEAAVLKLQKALGVVVDGIVGKQTLVAIETALLVSTPEPQAAASAATIDPKKRTLAKPATRDEAIKQAKDKAKAAAAAKVNVMRQKGIADAQAGKYAPPVPTDPPDYDTMNYQGGWISTGKPLPPGVILIGAGGVAVTSASDAGQPPAPPGDDNQKAMIAVGILGAAAVAAVFILKK